MKFSNRQKIQSYFRQKIITARSPQVSFGENIYIGRGSSICGFNSLVLESDIYIGKNVTIEVDGRIGKKTLIANNVGIVGRNDHDISDVSIPIFDAVSVRENSSLSIPVDIGEGVWIGYGAIILSGVCVGDNSVVAAGSVVTRNVPSNCIVAGCPARVISKR